MGCGAAIASEHYLYITTLFPFSHSALALLNKNALQNQTQDLKTAEKRRISSRTP
jgi:hypothetical protein